MDQFTFTGKEKRFALGLIGVGVLSAILAIWTDWGNGSHQFTFWTNFLQNTVFFTGLSFMAVFFYSAHTIGLSGWHTVFKRVWEAMFAFLPVGFVLLLVIVAGLLFNWHHLYHWAAEGITDPTNPHYDSILDGKSGLLNKFWFSVATIAIMLTWILFARQIRKYSIKQDEEGYETNGNYDKYKWWVAVYLPIAGFSSFAVILYWIMSLDPHWYSTMFAWYNGATWLVTCLAMTILLLIYLKRRGYFTLVNDSHFHDLGKYLFGFSIFWTYLWFSQFMLIWYANVGEETIYFDTRMNEYPVLFWGNLLINFVFPFFVLIQNGTKRKMGIMAFVAGVLVFGHWLDYYLMVKPGVWTEVQHSMHEHHDAHGEEGHSDILKLEDSEPKAVFTSDDEDHSHEGENANHDHDSKEHGEAHTDDAHADEHVAGAGHDDHGDHGHGHEKEFILGVHFPGFIDIGMFLGFLGLFLYVFFAALGQTTTVPKGDPYFEESKGHGYGVQGF